jgi:hypothetical protein
MRRLRVVIIVGALGIAACGGADDPSAQSDAVDATDAVDPVGTEATDASGGTVAMPAACTGPWSFELRAANAWAELPVIEEPAFEFTSSLAVRLETGLYTLYLADFDIDPEQFSDFETDHPPAGKILATLTINAFRNAETLSKEFDELVVGDVIPTSDAMDGERQFGVVLERGLAPGGEDPSDLYNTSSGPVGQAEVVGATDDTLCLEVDYTDYDNAGSTNGVADEYPVQKRLVGTFSAPIVDF